MIIGKSSYTGFSLEKTAPDALEEINYSRKI